MPLQLSKLLDLHLSRSIEKHKRPLPPTREAVMRKFMQLAEDVEADLKELDADADALQARRKAGKERARQAINAQHKIQDNIEAGVAAMEKIADAIGVKSNSRSDEELKEGNDKSGEGGGDSAATFPPKTG
jgi:predicted  nucleic acid-binding Zn-ribbon protein